MPAKNPAPTPRKGKGAGNAAVRRWRANDENRRREHLARALHEEVVKELIDKHHDEYVVRLNEKRLAAGLSPYRARGRAKIRIVEPEHKPDVVQQKSCPHNQGLRKLPYGTFCNECGARIR